MSAFSGGVDFAVDFSNPLSDNDDTFFDLSIGGQVSGRSGYNAGLASSVTFDDPQDDPTQVLRGNIEIDGSVDLGPVGITVAKLYEKEVAPADADPSGELFRLKERYKVGVKAGASVGINNTDRFQVEGYLIGSDL